MAELSSLQLVDLSNCNFTGPLPNITSWPDVQAVLLGANQLTGTLPAILPSPLQTLILTGNKLSGTLPMFNITIDSNGTGSLRRLDLSYNSIGGALPSSLGPFQNLTVVVLQGNALSGTLPSDWANMTSVQELVLSNNGFTVSLGGCASSSIGLIYALRRQPEL